MWVRCYTYPLADLVWVRCYTLRTTLYAVYVVSVGFTLHHYIYYCIVWRYCVYTTHSMLLVSR